MLRVVKFYAGLENGPYAATFGPVWRTAEEELSPTRLRRCHARVRQAGRRATGRRRAGDRKECFFCD